MEHRVIPFKRKQQNGSMDGKVWRRDRVQDSETSHGEDSSQSLFSDVSLDLTSFSIQAVMSGQIKKSRSVFCVIVQTCFLTSGPALCKYAYIHMHTHTHINTTVIYIICGDFI